MAVIAGDGDPSGIYSVGDIVVYVPAGEYAGQLCKDHMERVVEHELQHYVQHLSGEPWGAQSTGDDKKEYRSNTNEIQAFAMTAARNMRLNFMHIVSKLEKDNPGGPSMSSMCLAAWHRDNYPEKWALRYARTYGITNIKDFVLATVRNFNKMMASENKSDQTIPMENNIGKAASTDFPIHVAAETSKEDLSAERQYQSAMAKISERDVKVAVFRAINTVEQQFAESSGSKLRTIASSNTKNVSIETSLTEDRITLGLTVSFFHVPDDSKQILIELIKMAKPIISEEVRNVTGITPSSIKFTMIDTARAGGITRKDPPTTITPPDLSDYKQGDLLPDGHSPLGRRNSFLYLRLPEVPSKPISKGVFRTLSSCPGNGYFIAANYGEIIDRSTTPNNTNAVQIDSPKNPLPKNHCYVVDYASHKVISRLDRVNQK